MGQEVLRQRFLQTYGQSPYHWEFLRAQLSSECLPKGLQQGQPKLRTTLGGGTIREAVPVVGLFIYGSL